MELKTKVYAEDGKQELRIEREFDLPTSLVFKAHMEPELIEQWMGNKVLMFEAKNHGSWIFETKNPDGIVLFRANGVLLNIKENESFVRTFEMENTGFPIQLEFFEFQEISETKSKLIMQIIYKSVEQRDQILKMPFAQGINMAHNRLEQIIQN
ncbi:SRPBCC domain-containing protein [Leptospira sp. 2 VSF19]|uniref:SRPBCC domain-containing protein n=1 Tax=Leptospira soteropolitanensis TaxID=2950025 RepID=A0AAW5VMF2_9LEPT|nr:SRPBCC domain-containing protein [Leptospira soteropolitanensis]MCW7492667.1 SRPBCC domain-containing protein [Leptospira soteropolitanensis]MCW7500350.1 SRPBCC domain-containing protein [Leptospira soteropolitanensis]MCW7522615.1 SRPBCC domain-containing protein [Leptospira soteropolitanensis]MCW7526471.1 SRPBCC domain-containing protein [Leptospira soteropolitanensis]MCW7530320.1 SRPBCC domain-containing protein [Leptospira soteropolitanensis]